MTVNAAGGALSLPVHPECIIVFTYNSGAEDIRFKSALHDRMGNFDFEYPDVETESRRYAKMVTKMMALQQEAPELQREYSPEEMLPVVRIIERALQAAKIPQNLLMLQELVRELIVIVICFCKVTVAMRMLLRQ